jgi:hypothetical protein
MPTASQYNKKDQSSSSQFQSKLTSTSNYKTYSDVHSNRISSIDPFRYEITKIQITEFTLGRVKASPIPISKKKPMLVKSCNKELNSKPIVPFNENLDYADQASSLANSISSNVNEVADINLGNILASNDIFVVPSDASQTNKPSLKISKADLSMPHNISELKPIPLGNVHSTSITNLDNSASCKNMKKNAVASIDTSNAAVTAVLNANSVSPGGTRTQTSSNELSVVGLIPSEDRSQTALLNPRLNPVDIIRSSLQTDALNMSSKQFAMPKKDIWKSLIAELVGTALLVIVGCGCVLYTEGSKQLDLTGIAICWGLTVATLAQVRTALKMDLTLHCTAQPNNLLIS